MDGLLGQAHKKRQKNQRHKAEDQHRKQDEEVAKQTWLVLNDDLVKYTEAEKYNNYLEMHLGRSIEDITKDAMNAAEELVRKSIVFHGTRIFIG